MATEGIKTIERELGRRTPFTSEQARALLPGMSEGAVNKMLHDAAACGDVVRVARGLYCVPEDLGHGLTLCEDRQATVELLWTRAGGTDATGYVAGPSYAAHIGLQTLLPSRTDLYTNEWRRQAALAGRYGMALHKPRTEVTGGNWRALRLLDTLVDDSAFDCPSVERIVLAEVRRQGIEPGELLGLCRDLYPRRVYDQVRGLAYAA